MYQNAELIIYNINYRKNVIDDAKIKKTFNR